MLQIFRPQTSFGDPFEDEFLHYLAKIMNISVEQLKETYVAGNVQSAFEYARV